MKTSIAIVLLPSLVIFYLSVSGSVFLNRGKNSNHKTIPRIPVAFYFIFYISLPPGSTEMRQQ